MDEPSTVLKALLKKRHLQGHQAFTKEYNRAAMATDPDLKGTGPSRSQFFRWISGDVLSLPYPHHCRVLEKMFPGWTAAQLFQPDSSAEPAPSAGNASNVPAEFVALYAHRSDTPKSLWLNLLKGAHDRIDLFANASLFLPEDNPEAISIIKEKATKGVRVRILMGDPDAPAMELRGREERLHDALVGRIKMALAYYRPLLEVEGVEFRIHGTSLYNSIFRYDDQMLVNQHAYGTYGYLAPILHLRRQSGADMFDMYMRSLELVWSDEAYAYSTTGTKVG
ncbi:hypothetical protein [Alloactinosynnema sp. L-07]|uniref:XRE family transcriptional regulator n=1 Tax=Alloactinosynnema sp. L-07 TaxID=1653480 RepID=UPI00065F0A31|nr:XRE family transcriptional regulator [Alloactinosynnema sp. L-07]CRK59544.1 hypothetical protein [Alloactinosynnema sp. L-07]